jgi:hypothetical protein
MESEEFDPSPSSGDYRCKILIENDGENCGGKGRVGEIIHRPAKDLSFLNGILMEGPANSNLDDTILPGNQ